MVREVLGWKERKEGHIFCIFMKVYFFDRVFFESVFLMMLKGMFLADLVVVVWVREVVGGEERKEDHKLWSCSRLTVVRIRDHLLHSSPKSYHLLFILSANSVISDLFKNTTLGSTCRNNAAALWLE